MVLTRQNEQWLTLSPRTIHVRTLRHDFTLRINNAIDNRARIRIKILCIGQKRRAACASKFMLNVIKLRRFIAVLFNRINPLNSALIAPLNM
jgi:hypothetical protein